MKTQFLFGSVKNTDTTFLRKKSKRQEFEYTVKKHPIIDCVFLKILEIR